MFYDKKIIISGDVIEVYDYQTRMVQVDKPINNPSGRQNEATDIEKLVNRYQTLHRAENHVRRLINANAWHWENQKPKFFTLTFRDNITDNQVANEYFMKFIKRLNYSVFGSKKARLKYVVVVEYQKRGAIHYHAVFFNLPFIPAQKLEKIWSHGFIKINALDRVDNVGAYVTKYMGKDISDKRLIGEKCYFTSRGLIQPQEITTKKIAEQFAAALPCEKLVYENEFENDFVGKVLYKQYNLSKCENKQKCNENYSNG